MRGALVAPIDEVQAARIMPAYAGSTEGAGAEADGEGDHPRVCGEHNGVGTELCRVLGSSPRMRGAPDRVPRGLSVLGIIPAYAGSTHLPDV